MADLTLPQLRTIYAAAALVLHLDMMKAGDKLNPHRAMREIAGPQWRPGLRRAFAEVSRELAKATHLKRRK